MATIEYYLNPAEAVETEHCATVGESLLRRWPSGVAPRGLRIYRESVAKCNDVTLDTKQLLTPTDDKFIAVVEAGELTATTLAIISLVIAVASVLLAPGIVSAPPNANRNQQSANNSFGARSNEPRVNQRSADIRGKEPNAYPDLWQLPYRRFRNRVEYEYLYAQVSEGYVTIDPAAINDGATPFERITGARLAVYGPGTSPLSGTPQLVIDSAPTESLYVVAQSNEVTGAVLKAPNDSAISDAALTMTNDGVISVDAGIDFTEFVEVGDTVTINDFYQFQIIAGSEYVRLSLNGNYEVTAVTALSIDTDATFSLPTDPYDIPREAWRLSNGNWVLTDPGDPTAVYYQFYPSIDGVGDAGSVGPFTVSGYEKILINIVGLNGLYKDDGNNVTPRTVAYTVNIYELDVNDVRTGALVTESSTVGSATDLRTITGDSVEIDVPYALAEVEVVRDTPLDKDFAGTVSDEIQWRDLYLLNTVAVGDLDVSYATTIHAEIKATPAALKIKERKLNLPVVRNVAEYLGNGTFAATESTPSDMFADVIASIWRDPLFGRGEDDEVNWEQLFPMQAAMLTYYGNDPDPLRVGYTFDSDKISAEDAIKLICNAVNVIPYRIGSVLNFWFEQPQSESTMQFGHRFKHPGTDRRSRMFGPQDEKTGVELIYFDELTESYETLTRGSDVDPLKIELSGCITARGAQIRVDREWNKLRYSRIQHGFDATAIGRMAAPGMRIDVVDNTRYRPTDGEVRAVDGLTLTISQPVDLVVPSDYSVVLTRRDGSIESRSITGQPAPNKITIASAPSEAPYTGRDADKTAYSIATDDERTMLAMLVREINPRDYNRVGIGCINYDDRYYSEDNP